MRRFLPLLLALLVSPALASAAPVAEMRSCEALRIDAGDGTVTTRSFGAGWTCGTVAVVENRRTGAGVVRLRVARYHRPGPARPTVLGLAGGPGQGAFQYSLVFADVFSGLLGERDLIVYDQRGTGGSGYLDLAACTGRVDAPRGYDRCLAELGDARGSYRTADSVEDMEDIRRAFSIPRLLPIGVSYGTKVASDYARAYPEAVEAVVLDSPLAPEGLDPWLRDSLGASGRVFDEVCRSGACSFTRSARRDFERLLRLVADDGLVARVPWGRGGRRTLRFTQSNLFNLLLSADFSPSDRLRLPGLVHNAVNGDRVPLVRFLGEAAERSDSASLARTGYDARGTSRAERLYPDSSDLLYIATTCSDLSLPWAPGTGRVEARRAADAALAILDPASFFGWSKRAVEDLDPLHLCARFGGYGGAVAPTTPYPSGVRTLVIVGTEDLRTPLENARRYEASGAVVLAVPRAGHSVLTGGSRCAKAALSAFAAGGSVRPCASPTRRAPADEPIRLTTTRLDGAFEKEVMSGVADTLLASYTSNPIELYETDRGGLRGGWFSIRGPKSETASFHRYRFYRDLSLSGSATVKSVGTRMSLRIGGRTSGTVVARTRGEQITLVGRFGGRRATFDFTAYLNRLERRSRERASAYAPRAIGPGARPELGDPSTSRSRVR